MAFVRQQLEFFEATEQDAADRRKKGGGASGNVQAGSLGFRCIHCKHLPVNERALSADAFPNQVGLIYQSVRNYQRHHLQKCQAIPRSLLDKHETLPRRKKSKKMATIEDQWKFSANRKGIYEVKDKKARGGYRLYYSYNPTQGGGAFTADGSVKTAAAVLFSSSSAPTEMEGEPKRKRRRR
jgi:hypothetical protein